MRDESDVARLHRRLEAGGFRLEVGPDGERYRIAPESGEQISEEQAVEWLKDREERALEAAGWERTNVEGEARWRRPGSSRLYSREAAHDVLERGADEA